MALVFVSAFSFILGSKVVLKNANTNLIVDAREHARLAAKILEEKISIAKTMASAPVIKHSLVTSNKEFSSLLENQRKNKITELNKKWMEIKSIKDPFMQSYINNLAAGYLSAQQQLIPGEYGEIFLTNRYGALVATTGKLTTLAHGHKYWWQSAYNFGSVIDDRGFDESVGDRVLGIVVPVESEGQTIGILKCNLFLRATLEAFFEKGKHKVYSDENVRPHTLILRANGDIVLKGNENLIDENTILSLSDKMKKGISKSEMVTSNGKKVLVGYTPIKLSFTFNDKQALERQGPRDHSGGNLGDDWYFVSFMDIKTIMNPLAYSVKKLFGLGLLLVLIMALTVYFVSKKIMVPIEMLSKGVKQIGKGDYSSMIGVSSKDEIGDLAMSFDIMTKELRETTVSKDYIDNIMGSMIDSLFVIDPDAKIRTINKAISDLLGYREVELLEKDVSFLFSEEEEEEENTFKSVKLQKLIRDGAISDYEIMFKTKDGNNIPVLLSGAVMRDKDNDITDIVCVAKDITEYKEAERKIHQFRTALDNSADQIFLIDRNAMRFIDVNETACHDLQYSEDELLNLGPQDIKPYHTRETLIVEFDKIIKEQTKTGKIETVHKRKNGSEIPVEVFLRFFKIEGRDVVIATARDITERKKSEIALKEEYAFSKSLIDTAQVVILVVDKDARIVRINSYMEKIFGFSMDEVLGKDWFDTFLPLQDHSKTRALFKKSIDDINAAANINPILTKDGALVQIEWYDKTLKDNNGNTIGVLAIGQDITERKKAEEKNKELQTQLFQSQKMESVGILANGIAHNFNNILGAIHGFTEMALEDVEKDSRTHKDLERVINSVDMAQQLTAQMMTFSRMQEQETKEIEIAPIVREVIGLFKASVRGGVNVREKIDDNSGYVKADANQLQHMLLNICNNSFHAIKASADIIEVELHDVDVDEDFAAKVTGLKKGRYVKISVRDTGHGMDKETISRIFEPFFTTKEVGKGTGLGLSMVHGIIESYNGEITVESELGKGTTISIYLPQVDMNT